MKKAGADILEFLHNILGLWVGVGAPLYGLSSVYSLDFSRLFVMNITFFIFCHQVYYFDQCIITEMTNRLRRHHRFTPYFSWVHQTFSKHKESSPRPDKCKTMKGFIRLSSMLALQVGMINVLFFIHYVCRHRRSKTKKEL